MRQREARLGPRYILWIMVATRLSALPGGVVAIYYLRLVLAPLGAAAGHWLGWTFTGVVAAAMLPIVPALTQTRRLRESLRRLNLGRPVSDDLCREAACEAAGFAGRHPVREAGFAAVALPVCAFLTWRAGANAYVMAHVMMAMLLGLATTALIACLTVERLMPPVVRRLAEFGVHIDCDALPVRPLRHRLLFPFMLTTTVTGLLMAGLATAKVGTAVGADASPAIVLMEFWIEAVVIVLCAAAAVLGLSRALSRPASESLRRMAGAVRDVGAGCLKRRLAEHSTDELGALSRGFDNMTERLEAERRRLRDRSAELEHQLDEHRRQLADARKQLAHSEKMSALGELAAGLAHEVNNSINAAYHGVVSLREQIREAGGGAAGSIGAVERADRPAALGSIDDLAGVVERAASRAAGIVADLKTFAHPGEGRREMFDIHDGLRTAINLLSGKMRGRVTVHQDYCDDGRLMCRGGQLVQVFLNLLDNAQQAIGGQGDIWIRTERTREALVARVRDSGAGIPERVRSRVFEAFFTTKSVGVGTGLGLSISANIVRGHGGSIEVVSPPAGCDRGTEFTMTLPLTGGEPHAGAAAEPVRAVSQAAET